MKRIIFIVALICCFSCKKEMKNKDNVEALQNEKLDTIGYSNYTNKKVEEKQSSIKERFYHVIIHNVENNKDTIVNLDYLESDDLLDFSFKYKPFEKRFYKDSISLLKTNMEVVIVKSKFEASKSVYEYDKDSINIVKIDGHDVVGAEDIPKTYISKLYFNLSGHYFEIPKEYYEDLYEPDFNRANAYYYDNEIIITMDNSDGYLGYRVILILDKQKSIKRIFYRP